MYYFFQWFFTFIDTYIACKFLKNLSSFMVIPLWNSSSDSFQGIQFLVIEKSYKDSIPENGN